MEQDEGEIEMLAGISPISGSFFDVSDAGGRSFLELLGIQDLHQSPFELPPPPESRRSSSVNIPATSNSSSLSSSSAETDPPVTAPAEMKPKKKEARVAAGGLISKTKKGAKRLRVPRFAFVTKSEVDHLEDGYRWRKYGQKAVKNSPFPRSYFRCTTAMCGVKKRVERSSDDPAVVVTTYEGQHTHPSPAAVRGGGGLVPASTARMGFATALPSYLNYLPVAAQQVLDFRSHAPTTANAVTVDGMRYSSDQPVGVAIVDRTDAQIRDHGLLQDVIPIR